MENNCEKPVEYKQTIRRSNLQAEHELNISKIFYQKLRIATQVLCIKHPVIKIFALSLFILFDNSKAYSQNDMDYAIHANIVYRFTKYINWPENKKKGDFIIGIVGDSPLFDELKNFVANKKVGSQKIVLKKFSSSLATYDCHILFIADEKSKALKKIVATTKGTSTLLVSETDGLATRGSCINFVVIEDHLKLEINKNNIQERDLSIATELLSLAILVK